ncbi:UNVERIFIED_CONTAM: hypothetical protein Slati_1472000 [Sesamum latifolium]|uniref:Uncharacterized protein n=1 Tax=Sesamum latifolium TaxID=2727402 RepID=A0AAW2XAF0_9LAMI
MDAPIFCKYVYEKCNKVARECIWDFMLVAADEGGRWMISADFNTVLCTNERSNGTYPTHHSIDEFSEVIFNCQLVDIGFEGSAYTWTDHRLRQRLDRVLFSGEWIDSFPLTKVTHLPTLSSDHCPLLVQLRSYSKTSPSIFCFQNMWCRHASFWDMMTECWDAPIGVGGMLKLKLKLKRLKLRLKQWNSEVFCDVFQNLMSAKLDVKQEEQRYDANPSDTNLLELNRLMVVLHQNLVIEEDYLH